MDQHQHEPVVVTSWDPPPWAEWNRADERAIIHCRRIGTYAGSEGSLDVLLVQRDEIDESSTMVTVNRHPAYVLLAGEQLPPEQATFLANLLLSAADVANRGELPGVG